MTKKDLIEDNANAELEGYREGLQDVNYRIRWAARNRAIVEKCESLEGALKDDVLGELYRNAKTALQRLESDEAS